MLKQIYVKNFILIDEVNLSFDQQMSTFTGETGAGKSLLMDAIGVLKGDRIRSDMIKEGKEKAIIEGVFDVSLDHIASRLLIEAGYDLEDRQLIVTREITRDGKSSARINHRMTTIAFLRELLATLVDIHSQHDTQYLLNSKYHISLLDRFCDHDELRNEVKQCWKTFKKFDDERKEALLQDYNEDDLEYLTFQLNEITEAQLRNGELEELEETLKKMSAYEKITAHIQKATELIEEDTIGSNNRLYEAYKELNGIQEDDIFVTISGKLIDAYYMVEEATNAMHTYIENMDYDEQVFNEIQERIYHIRRIYRKYGGDYDAIQSKYQELDRRIDIILHRQDYINHQNIVCDQAYELFLNTAQRLHEQRSSNAKLLEQRILTQLQDLMLPNAHFCVDIQPCDGSSTGIDQIEFLISMNAGERLKRLSLTASGGELSRFMLGMKSVFTNLQGIETVIFDEIDTGVSGSVAFSIGKKMRELGIHTQVFCVTHLAAVAACANQHYLVEKTQENATTTSIRQLNEAQRIEQLALIASDSTSKSAIDAASELYIKAQNS